MRRYQTGITAIGFLLLASLVGILGFGVLKVTPLYMQSLRVQAVLDDVEEELNGTNPTPTRVRQGLLKRLNIEGLRIPMDKISVKKGGSGYIVRIAYDNKTHFVADIWLMVVINKQVEITR